LSPERAFLPRQADESIEILCRDHQPVLPPLPRPTPVDDEVAEAIRDVSGLAVSLKQLIKNGDVERERNGVRPKLLPDERITLLDKL
jgi:hypothetical protein